MRITPLDIQQKQFPMKLRGFDVEEVYAFLEIVREELEDQLRDNASLKENVQRLTGDPIIRGAYRYYILVSVNSASFFEGAKIFYRA